MPLIPKTLLIMQLKWLHKSFLVSLFYTLFQCSSGQTPEHSSRRVGWGQVPISYQCPGIFVRRMMFMVLVEGSFLHSLGYTWEQFCVFLFCFLLLVFNLRQKVTKKPTPTSVDIKDSLLLLQFSTGVIHRALAETGESVVQFIFC